MNLDNSDNLDNPDNLDMAKLNKITCIAWIQTKGSNSESWHTAEVENWSSSTRVEATAIATALLTV